MIIQPSMPYGDRNSIDQDNEFPNWITESSNLMESFWRGFDERTDLQRLQRAIDYSIKNKVVLTSPQKNYIIDGSLLLNGSIQWDFSNSTITATTEDPMLIDNVILNTYNGRVIGLVLDCKSIAKKAIYAPSTRRRIYDSISILNHIDYGIHIEGGNVSNFHNIWIEGTPKFVGGIGIWNEAADMVFDHVDLINSHTCVYHTGGNTFYSGVHGFVRDNDVMYKDSKFFHIDSVNFLSLHECYPDTQQYAYYIEDVAMLKLTNNYLFMNRDFLDQALLTRDGDPYLFYIDYPTSPISATSHITIQSSFFFGLEFADNTPHSIFCNLPEYYIAMDQTSDFRGFIDPPRGGFYKPTFVSGMTGESEARVGEELVTIWIDANYNPSVQGKLSRTTGRQVANLRNSRFQQSKPITFIAPYGTTSASGDGIVYLGQVIGYVGTDNLVYIKSTSQQFDGNTDLCNAADNTNYIVRLNFAVPVYAHSL